MMIELGSNQFYVENINLSSAEVNSIRFNVVQIVLQIIDGPNQPDRFVINLSCEKSVFSIGRKPSADIAFTEDHHLSNVHAKVVLIDGVIYLEDMGSTNG
jgi:pSer/pThr/pTyr-binding forkhead associated (FHA) protein